MLQTTHMRAADADRERALAELQRHTSAGRLSMDEFSERAAAVYRSRTMSELAALTADLPLEESPSAAGGIARTRWTGVAVIAGVATLAGLAATFGPMFSSLGCGW